MRFTSSRSIRFSCAPFGIVMNLPAVFSMPGGEPGLFKDFGNLRVV